jgi:hypothetical protein
LVISPTLQPRIRRAAAHGALFNQRQIPTGV